MIPDFLSGKRSCLSFLIPQKYPSVLLWYLAFSTVPWVTSCLDRRKKWIPHKCWYPVAEVRVSIKALVADSPARIEGMVWEDGWKSNILSEVAVPADSALRLLIGQRPGRSGAGGALRLDGRSSLLSGLTSRGQLVVSQASAIAHGSYSPSAQLLMIPIM